ncbi:TRAP transporter small permease [Planococcus salinus]|uniref:TRAP transporter small permease n=1 Tax=Planococcus salinus TaxID=1848460 RepID=UPI001314B199|nr:TRAP transporter small permease subunit [Planococcus salinus]
MSQRYLSAYKVFQKIKWLGMLLSGITIFFMMFYTSADVLIRNINGTSPLHAYEISQYYFMPLAVFPALAYTFGEGMMPRIEFVITKAKSLVIQRIAAISLIVIEIVLMLLLAVFGWQYLMHAFGSGMAFTAGGTNYPLSLVILFVPLGFFLVVIEMIFLLVKNIKGKQPSFVVIEKHEVTDV